MKEIWRKIPDAPSNYEISNLGNIRKEVFGGGHQLIKKSISDGYYTVCFEGKQFKIHRLVASAFLTNPNPNIYKHVRFKNGDKLDPSLDNIEWATLSETNQSKYRLGTKDDNMILCTETNQVFSTIIAAAVFFGMPKEAVNSAIKLGHPCFGKTFVHIHKDELEEGTPIYYISTSEIVSLSKIVLDVTELKSYVKWTCYYPS